MAIAWMLEARASETCAVRSVSCPRAFSGVADVGFAGESGVFVGVRGLDGSGGSGEGSVVRLIILWILSRVRTLVGGVRSCGFWGETATGLPGELTVTEAKQDMRAESSRQNIICSRCYRGCPQRGGGEAVVR